MSLSTTSTVNIPRDDDSTTSLGKGTIVFFAFYSVIIWECTSTFEYRSASE